MLYNFAKLIPFILIKLYISHCKIMGNFEKVHEVVEHIYWKTDYEKNMAQSSKNKFK